MEMILEHATCVEVETVGILLRGPSGSGKSDLALRLIDRGGKLVADDQVLLQGRDSALYGSPPDSIAGLIEVRGVGILRVPYLQEVEIGILFDLMPDKPVERLPDPVMVSLAGTDVPSFSIAPFEAAAETKVRLVARWRAGHIERL